MNAGNVFRAYDIRGVVDKDFNAEWVTHLGKACGTYLAGRGISSAVIGYDCRHSSPAYHDALVEGILSTGTDVISIGMVPTPALYFAVKHLNRQGGVMITASHNPPEYNGYKVYWEDGAQLPPHHADAIAKRLEEIDIFDGVKRMDFEEAVKSGLIETMGDETDRKFMANVTAMINDRETVAKVADTFKLVYTPFHGCGWKLVPEALRGLGVKNLYCVEQQMVLDGTFPTVASPNPENPEGFYLAIDLAKKVGKTVEEVQPLLDNLVYYGIFRRSMDKTLGEDVYYMQIFAPGILEMMVNQKELLETHPEVGRAFDEYTRNLAANMGAMIPDGYGLMRVIPVESALEGIEGVSDYERISHYLDKYDRFSVSPCSCRASRSSLGDGCGHLEEDMCVQMGRGAEHYIRTGRAREITREQALEIIQRAEENGLMHDMVNIEEPGESAAICNCCACACFGLRVGLMYGARDAIRSNYVAEVDEAKCVACGQCVETCPGNALKLGQKLCSTEDLTPKPDYVKLSETIHPKRSWNPDYREDHEDVMRALEPLRKAKKDIKTCVYVPSGGADIPFDDSNIPVHIKNDLNAWGFPSDSVLEKVGALKADILIDITRPGCYALQYIALRHPSAFKVGIKYPGQEWYDLGLTVTDKDDIQYLFGQILFYLRSIRAK